MVAWEGTFTGSVRFEPDANLTGFIRSGKLKGTIQSLPRWHCPAFEAPPSKFNPDAGGVDVFASNCDGRSFGATVEVKPAIPPSLDDPVTADFSASWTKSVGIASVTYTLFAEGRPETAVFSDDLAEGEIRPPPPFHGEARIVKQGEGWTWTGSLSAHFPGRTVKMTGSGFEPQVITFKPRPYTGFVFSHSESC